MSRFDDIYSKSKKKPEEETKLKTTNASGRFEEILNRVQSGGVSFSGVDENYINTFISDSNSFLSSAEEEYGKIGWSNASSSYESRKQTWDDLYSRSGNIRAWLNYNKNKLDADTYKSLLDNLDSFHTGASSILNTFEEASNYYSQWETEDDYKSYLEGVKNHEALLSYDLGAGAKEIEGLRRSGDHYSTVTNLYTNYLNGLIELYEPEATETPKEGYEAYEGYNPDAFEYEYDENGRLVDSVHNKYQINGRYITKEGLDKLVSEYEILSKKYGNYGDFASTLSEKERYHKQAERTQEGAKLASVSGNADFNDYSGYTSANKGDFVYEIINGNTDAWEDVSVKQAWGKISDDEINRLHSYANMTEDEVDIYNYYYAKEGKKAADKYLDSIQETLNYRQATDMADSMEGKYLLELAFGLAAGLDQFDSGLKGLINSFTGNDEYVPPSATQIASGMVREDLGNIDPKLWYNFKDGEWESNIFGSPLGQVGYDAVTTISNKLPSILVTKGLGMTGLGASKAGKKIIGGIGAGTLGASASGNAYQEMINLGYDKGQARAYATLIGGSEAILQYAIGGISSLSGGSSEGIFQSIASKWLPHVDNAFARVAIKLGSNMLDEGLEEGIQEILNPWFKNLTLHTNEKVNWSDVAYSSLLGALTAGFMEGPSTIAGDVKTYKTGKKLQAADISAERLAKIGSTFSADTVAYQLAGKVNENTGAYTMGRLFNEIGATLTTQNVNDITTALMKKGMDAKTAKANAEALAYVMDGGQLSDQQIAILEANDVLSKTAMDVLLDESATWNQRSNGYNEMLNAFISKKTDSNAKQAQQPHETTEVTGDQVAMEVPKAAQMTQAKPETVQTAQEIATPVSAPARNDSVDGATGKESLQVTEESTAAEEPKAKTVTLKEVSEKYGAQAQAMIHTYTAGQDVEKYDQGYQAAYDMGKSGVSFDYVKNSQSASYLTDTQKQLAYEAGKAASDTAAKELDAKNKAAANGKTGRKKGVVRGEGVTIADLKKTFNDPQGKAYKALSTVAEVTGIDIVLYRSEAGQDGKFQGAQGRYRRSEPGTLYIDLNAGLSDIKSVDDLAKYAMLRTFSHEFSHFIENWNPIQYNEFRKVVFDTLTERGVNVHDLIEQKQAQNPGLSYDDASREVVAESMTDILLDANFVQKLAENHKTIFQKLLDKLKEFVANLREYFNSIGYNSSREANALKEKVGETVKYLDSIVDMFDRVAVEAVENYQQTVATEEVAVVKTETTTTVSETESVAATEEVSPVVETDAYGFTISDNVEHGSLEITFDSKPSDAVRDVLKENKFRWNKAKKVWYGYGERESIRNLLRAAYGTETKPAESVQMQAEEVTLEPTPDLEVQKPAKAEVTAEKKVPEVMDAYSQLSDKLSDVNVSLVKENGLTFSVYGNEKDGYYGKIKRVREQSDAYPVANARELVYKSAVFKDRQEAVDDIVLIARISDLLTPKENIATNVEEVTENGQNEDNRAAVQQPEPDGRGAARLLEKVEARDVPGDGRSRDTVADTGERGQPTVRDGSEPGQRTGDVSGYGERSGQSGNLRGADRVTTEESAADTNDGDKLHKEVAQQIAQQSTEKPKGRNFVIGDSLDLPNGEKARYKANVEAIRLVKQLEAEGRYATEAEQVILSKYVGWGGLANAFDQRKTEWSKEFAELKELLTDEEYTSARGSTLNAHYTDISVIKAMYDGLKQLGFTGGRMMEPSSGVGNFVGAMPADMASKVRSWTMVELDGITGLIAKYLYPNADVRIQGFEKANIPNNFMDVAISNVPFGNYAVVDKSYPKKVTSAIHNYFFAKSLDKVRPGGVVMFITSSYTMNSSDTTVRSYIMQKADLLGAIRLPDSAFKGNAGTEVVTDILVLKKRAENTAYSGEDFLEAPYQYINGYNGAFINSYFANHPEMVLGTASMEGGMYRGSSLTYKAFTDRGSLADQIREAFKNIQGKMDYPVKQSPEKTNFAVERAGKKTKNNGLVVKDGKVYQNKNGELQEVTVAKGTAERITGMLDIRDAAKELITYQQQGLKDAEIRKARLKLNKAYDAFVKKYGFINSQANRSAIKADPDSFSILALENWNPETKKAVKSDIFSKNTIAPNRTVTAAKDVAEGLIVSVNQTGGVDAALIAKLTGKTEADVTRELLDSRAVFKDRDGSLETAEVYLSGNVRAKLRDAEAMVPLDADYQKNVEALKAVMPEDVGYQDIFVNPGTPWIPSSVYSDFAAYMLGTSNSEWRQAVDVTRSNETGNFTVELKNRYLKTNSYNTQKWGTNRRSFLDLFDAMLNSKSVVVRYKDADGKTVVDQDATAAANEKVEAIQKEFQEWLWKDEGRRTELATLYNETFNSIVTPKYNGDNLTVNGANAMKPLRPHQRDAVQRVISSGGNTLLAHKVGAGKTYEMAAAAMKLKELGLVKKPLFAVPKSLVAQWGNEFVDFFPTAKLLVAEAGDFTAANRKIFANRIANGDYDAVIVSYEQFEKLPISADFARDLYQEQIDGIIAAIEEAKTEKGGKSLSVKDLEKKRKSLQTKIEKLTDSAKDEDNIEFEQLGVDSIFVDEAHNFKNLFYTTSMTNVSGLGNKDGSKRAFDLYTKVRYLQKLNGGRGIVFATATPVMNSMSEMYIMQKYLQSDLLDQLGLSTFDAWAKQFGEVVNGVEIKPSGQGYRVKQSFSRFKNMSELQLLFRNFADVLTDIPGLKIPKMKGGKVNVVVCEPGQFQQDYMKELEKRADNIKNVDPSEDNMLKITSDGRKISYTQRMIDPSLPYEEGCKIYRCADNVVQAYQDSKDIKGTQLIFCDMATPKGKSKASDTQTEEIETDIESARLYDDIKARLMKGGIPAKEIAFIHEADTDAKKKKLFADVNDGKVRVLIGSTGKMGVGMNAQKRIVAIHHLDAPWRPGDVEQRNGRAFRQGNINEEVENFTYVTEGSFDARLWDILDRKQNFINQVMNGESVGRETEDTGEVTLSAAEVKALASGSPLIMEQVQLDTDIKKLESLRRAHRSAVTNALSRLQEDKGRIDTLEKMIENGKADAAARVDTYSEGKFSITIGKQKFTEKKDAGVALMAEATAKANEDGYTTIAKFAGFDLRVIKTHEGIKGLISGKQGYAFKTYPDNTTYMINHLVARVGEISEAVSQWEQELEQTRKDMAEQEKLITQPFAKQAELDQKRARYNEVMEILNPKEEQALDSVAEDDVQYQGRDYLSEGENYDNRGIQTSSDRASGQHQSSQGRDWETTVDGRRDREDDRRSRKVKAWGDISAERRLEIVKAVKSHIYNSANYDEIRLYLAAIIGKPVTEMNIFDQQSAVEKLAHDLYESITDMNNSRPFVEQRWSFLGNVQPIIEAIYGENVQFQQRTNTLTDREVLALAASQVKVNDMTAAEKDALDIFQQRLSKLESLQTERAEQGRLYKEQQFGANVDRAKAAETLNRMQVLDGQIQKASAEVLSVEEKTVLKRVLQKARTVVEQQERQHGQEILKRWRDRRNNADAIKKYRDRLRGDVDELTNWVLHPDNKSVVKHIPDALKSTVLPFLSSINFMSKRSLAGGNPTQADKALMEQTRRLAKVMENTVDIDDMYSNYTDLPPDFMKNLRNFIDTAQEIVDNNSGDFIINQMTAEELKTLSKVVRTLKEYIMKMNRFHVNSMFKHVYDAGENSIDFMAQLKPAENTGAVSQFLLWQQMRPAYAFERFGKGGQAVYDGLRQGQATLAFNTKKITEFSKKAYTAAEVKAWENEVKTIRIGPGKTVTMPVSYIMGLYELNKREQAQGHIFGDGIRVATFKNGKKKISDVGQTLTPGELNMILRELTPRQKEVADNLQQFMEKQGGEWGNFVTVARFGEKQFGEPNYYPINSDGRHLSVEADEKPGAASLYALLNMGFTKQTQEKAKNRLIVYSIFDVFSNHMASMAQYNAFALPVVDALKWFNYQRIAIDDDGSKTILGSVREQMDRSFGVPEENRPGSGRRGYAQNFVINIIKALNGTEAQGTAYDSWGLQTLHRYNRAQVAYNFRVVVQQPLAITRAAQLLDYASIIKGMKLQPAAIRKNIQEMQQYSGIAAWKSLGFYDVNISRGLTSIIKHDDTVFDKVTDVGMWGAEKADTMTWAAIWSACKEEVIRKQKLTPKSEGFYEAVTKLFEEVIYKTQVVDSVLTKNEFMRDKGFWARAVGSFMSEPTTTASMLVDAYDKYHMDMQRGMNRQQAWKKNSKMIVRTAYVYGIGALILAAVQAAADAFRDDDDYQEWYEKWLEAFGGNLVDEAMPFNKLPILTDFYDLAKELLSFMGVNTYGNPPQSVFMQWYDSLVKGTEIVYDKISGEDTNYTWYGGAYKLLQAASGMTGLPMAGATREIATAWNNIVGAMAPSLKVKTYDPGEKNEIKYAYQDGYLTAEEATALLLEKNLVDTEDEAYWTIQSWEAGEGYSKYGDLYDAALNGSSLTAAMSELTAHGYTEKEVMAQLKSQIGKWYYDENSKIRISKQQAINMLTKYFTDMDSDEITSTVNKWSSKIDTGIAFDDIKDKFMSGNITADMAIDMYVRYGDYSEEEAGEKVDALNFVKQHPETDGISYAGVEAYQTYCEAQGVTAKTFYDVWKYNSNTEADVDANGKIVSGSKKDKVLAYINSLNLTSAQKDSLYYAFGWAASKLYEAPWH